MSKETNKKEPNRLIHEASPYLLQHAHNPVDWYPWGEEAFKVAKQENKPIMVSIGYSTCHWCHVMERESFEDQEVAKHLNERFICIKVDREERPDIDNIYMKVVQGITGQGGWPLHAFLTPDQKPFYGGVYFPKESRYGKPGIVEVVTQLSNQYIENPEKLQSIGNKITNALAERVHVEKGNQLEEKILHQCFQHIRGTFDTSNGGFGKAPKFPTPHLLTFLLKYYRWTNEEQALHYVTKTLDSMEKGGIYDHIGYGFSRYSVDEAWLVPHFEKMLYDNALLAMTYLDAFTVTKKKAYQEVVEEILTYIERDMTDAAGGFYSAQDADSEGVEGKFYVWTPDEILALLGEKVGALFCKTYDITQKGNFEGNNIPNYIHTNWETVAKEEGVSVDELKEDMEAAKVQLFNHRKTRIHPYKDDKILTSWNGYMIAAFAKAGRVFSRDHYTNVAKKAYSFIKDNLLVNDRLQARYRNGKTAYKGYHDDYANLIWASIELYETTYELAYLEDAKQFTDDMIDLFWDEEDGGFYFSGKDAEALILRPKELFDSATPSGNSVAANQLWKLAKLTGDTRYDEYLHKMFQVFSEEVSQYPTGFPHLLEALLLTVLKGKELVVLGSTKDATLQTFLKEVHQQFLPEVTILSAKSGKSIAPVVSFAADYDLVDQATTIYLCEDFQCDRPTTDTLAVLKKLK